MYKWSIEDYTYHGCIKGGDFNPPEWILFCYGSLKMNNKYAQNVNGKHYKIMEMLQG